MLLKKSSQFILLCCLLFLANSQDQPAPLQINLIFTDTPDSQDYPQQAQDAVTLWDPFISQFLNGPEANPPRTINFNFQKGLPAPALTGGDTINVNVDYINSNPTDIGMMIHEYTHIIQGYPGNQVGYDAGWLTEGIADYVRYIYYEPNPTNAVDPPASDSWFVANQPQPTDTYRSGYGNAARFLYWIGQTKNIPDLVPQLNEFQRHGQFQPSVIQDITSASISDLWNEYAAAMGVPDLAAPQPP